MAITAPGTGSGLDVNGIISQLMALEQRPLTNIATKEAKLQAKISAYGSFKGSISAFQSAVAALANPAKFTGVKASITETAVATVSAASGAAVGTYALEVQTLAQAQKLKSTAFEATSTTVGSGKLTISYGTYSGDTFTLNPEKASQEVTIAAGKESLAGIRDAINAANIGVTAGIVNDGTGNRLTISSKDTGVANAIRIEVADADGTHTDTAGLSQLAFDARTLSGVTNLTETVAAKNAAIVIDGIAVSKASNTITDAIGGMTLNLLKANTPSSTTVTVAQDTAGIQASVQAFVKAYNDLNKTITDLTKYDSATRQTSALTGDSTVRSVQSQLRAIFNAQLETAGGGLTKLADAGITFQTNGTLKLDSAKLTSVLNDPTKDLSTLFAAVAKPTDSLVKFETATANTKNGSYALNVTQLATQGRTTGGAAAALTINAGVNDTLSLTVDGVAATVTLSARTYTATSLAAEVQAKINGAAAISSAGAKVAVTQNAGVLTVTSARYGSASKAQIDGGTAKADLFGTATQADGVDVAGTIGGVSATGNGQTLTGMGNATGLALKITGGALGDRGTVNYGRGYAYELEKLAGRLLGTDSLVEGRISGLNASVKDLGTQRTSLISRLEQVEKRYRAQFTALDTLMSRMQQTSNYLTQQLANLPKSQ